MNILSGSFWGKPDTGAAKKPEETASSIEERWRREKNETHAELERLAKIEADKLEYDQDALLANFERWHAEDVKSYKFSCKRHGDFLTLTVSRISNAKAEFFWWGADAETEQATTINIGGCKEIRLVLGGAPDRCGVVDFGYRLFCEDGSYPPMWGMNFGNYPAMKGCSWRVTSNQGAAMAPRPLITPAPPRRESSGFVSSGYDDSYKIKTKLKDAAQQARDDEIVFYPNLVTVSAPAGLGKKVHAAVLRELARGAKPKKMPPPRAARAR